jgi:hypothetical protein
MDGSATTEEWKTAAETTIAQILGCNNPDRTMLAHSFLEPNVDASVKLTPLRLSRFELQNSPKTWSEADFRQKIERLRDLTQRLQSIKSDLSAMKITMLGLGWMTSEPHLRPAQRYAGAILPWSDDGWLAHSPNEDKPD